MNSRAAIEIEELMRNNCVITPPNTPIKSPKRPPTPFAPIKQKQHLSITMDAVEIKGLKLKFN